MLKNIILPVVAFFFVSVCSAQMITGVWQGKINRQKVELKIVQNGDSLTGSSYYYHSSSQYRRYSIKGYFDDFNQVAVWWDDELLEEKGARAGLGSPGRTTLLSQADFNCPDGGVMKLEGEASLRSDPNTPKGAVQLSKTNQPAFDDEWDFVIRHYTAGANDPDIIDSVGRMATNRNQDIARAPVIAPPPARHESISQPPPVAPARVSVPLTIEQKFAQRQKIPVLEIPLSGDSIELNFYDNAEIDGDSITLFLNGKLIYEHIYLTDKPFVVILPLSELQQSNELVMVAENLGSIPPNTSFMVANVSGKRYEARLESNEGSSAMIRFAKE